MNNKIKIKISIVLLLAIPMFFGCTEDFDKLNTPKNLVTDEVVDVNLIFTRIQAYIFIRDKAYGTTMGNHRAGNYCGLLAAETSGLFNQDAYNAVWTSTYTNYARNLSRIIYLTDDDPDLVNKNAIARILKVLAFSECTDMYGDIPYSESALPLDEINYTPKYDTQKSIYEDFFSELKDAASQLDESKESYGSSDILYGGDVEKWKKFANSLRFRLALRIRYVDNQLASTQMSDLNEANMITSSDDNAYTMTSTDFNENRNKNYADLELNGVNTYKPYLAKTLIDLWQESNDPRLAFYADTAMATYQSFGYRGRPVLGDAPIEQKYPYDLESVSRYSLYLYAPIVPIPVITAAETNFSLAEAALFGLKGSGQDAQDYYKKGMEAAMEWSQFLYETTSPQLSELFSLFDPGMDSDDVTAYDAFHAMSQTDIDNFINSGTVSMLDGNQEEKLEMIINQKMLSYFPSMVYEGYADWRRTGYPRVLVGDDTGELQGVAPRRYLYPKYEQDLNEDSYDEVIQRIGSDHMHTKMWWDANPDSPHMHPGEVEWREEPWIQ